MSPEVLGGPTCGPALATFSRGGCASPSPAPVGRRSVAVTSTPSDTGSPGSQPDLRGLPRGMSDLVAASLAKDPQSDPPPAICATPSASTGRQQHRRRWPYPRPEGGWTGPKPTGPAGRRRSWLRGQPGGARSPDPTVLPEGQSAQVGATAGDPGGPDRHRRRSSSESWRPPADSHHAGPPPIQRPHRRRHRARRPRHPRARRRRPLRLPRRRPPPRLRWPRCHRQSRWSPTTSYTPYRNRRRILGSDGADQRHSRHPERFGRRLQQLGVLLRRQHVTSVTTPSIPSMQHLGIRAGPRHVITLSYQLYAPNDPTAARPAGPRPSASSGTAAASRPSIRSPATIRRGNHR